MPTAVRTRMPVEERRAALVELGVTLFSRYPFDSLSVDRVAKDAGVSKGLLFHYFGSKRGFYVAVLDHLARRLIDATALDPDLETQWALRRSLLGFVHWVSDNATIYAALMRGGIGSDDEVFAIVENVRRVSIDRVCTVLGIETLPPDLFIRLSGWIGYLESSTVAWTRIDERSMTAEELVDAFVETLWAAVGFKGTVQ